MNGTENPDEPSGSCSEINRIRCFVKQDNLFVPGACTQCHKLPSENVNIKSCSNCRLVYYCGKECQRNNWSTHKELCKAASSAARDLIGPNAHLMDGAKCVIPMGMDYEMCIQAAVNSVCDKLDRKIKDYEGRMICLTKVCEICKEADHALLTPCKICYMTFYCSEECANQDSKRHRKICPEYLLALNCYHLASTKGHPLPGTLPFWIPRVATYKPLSGTLKDYIKPTIDACIDACMTDYVTYPFSLLYALQHTGLADVSKKVNNTKELTVLMLDAFSTMFRSMDQNLTWEYMLHLLPNLKVLNIMCIEPDETTDTLFLERTVDLCFDCKSRKCKLYVTKITDYNLYKLSEIYKNPDVILNHKVSNKEGTIKYLDRPDPKVPIVLVYMNKEEINESLNTMKQWKREKFKIILPLQLNPFRAMRPRKHYKDHLENGSYLHYINSYIIGLRRKPFGKSFVGS